MDHISIVFLRLSTLHNITFRKKFVDLLSICFATYWNYPQSAPRLLCKFFEIRSLVRDLHTLIWHTHHMLYRYFGITPTLSKYVDFTSHEWSHTLSCVSCVLFIIQIYFTDIIIFKKMSFVINKLYLGTR